jgi:hypothetical protein
MDNLQPGRNYSISVKAVSNGIESIERTVFQAAREYIRTYEYVHRIERTVFQVVRTYVSTCEAVST